MKSSWNADRSAFKDTRRIALDLRVQKEENGLYETVVRTASVPMIITDTQGRVVIWNLAAERIFGWSEDETLGGTPPHVEDGDFAEFESLIERAVSGETIMGVKTKRRNRNGNVVFLEKNLSPVRDSTGKVIGIAMMMTDVTLQTRAEEALRISDQRFTAFMENLPGTAWMKDTNGRYVYANRAARQWPHYEHCIGKTDREMMPAQVAEGIREHDLRVMADMAPVQTVESYFVNDEWRQNLINRFPILTDGEATMLIGGIGMDVTGQRKIEAELVKAAGRMESLSRRLLNAREVEKRHIARELHDQIGQSLTAVKFEIEGAKRLTDSEDCVMRLDDGLVLVDQLIKAVRALSLDLRPALLDELGLASALREYIQSQADRVGFVATFDCYGNVRRLDSNVEISCFRVTQEALTNISRHARAKLVQVELWFEVEELTMRIRDDGAGFDVMTAVSGPEQGTGFGMLSMRERVELCGGAFYCQSSAGEGTEIRAVFPLSFTSPS